MKKIKVHRPAECRCRNCCHNPRDRALALLNQKRRLLGQEKPYKAKPAYKQRQFRMKYPPLGGPRKRKSLWRFYRWKTSTWEMWQRMKKLRTVKGTPTLTTQ